MLGLRPSIKWSMGSHNFSPLDLLGIVKELRYLTNTLIIAILLSDASYLIDYIYSKTIIANISF